jgi:holo-[acyl-carrier protein] synthase
MIENIGVDIIENERFRSFLTSETKVKKILSPEELKIYQTIKLEKRQLEYLASRFAAKEALFKAGIKDSYQAISILNANDGRPYVVCPTDKEIKISLSHSDTMSIAMVVIKEKK